MEHIPNIYPTYSLHIPNIYSTYSLHIPCIYLGTILYIPKDKILHFFYHYKSLIIIRFRIFNFLSLAIPNCPFSILHFQFSTFKSQQLSIAFIFQPKTSIRTIF